MKKQIVAAAFAALMIGAAALTGCSASSEGSTSEPSSETQSASSSSDIDRAAVLAECQKTADAFFKDFFKMEGIASHEENEAYLKGLVKYFSEECSDLDFWAMYAPISLDYREFYKDGYKAEFKILSYITEKATLTPDLDSAEISDSGDTVTIPYTIKIRPGLDVFQVLQEKDLLDWFCQWYDKALDKVLAAIDEVEPVTKTFEMTFKKEDGQYKIDTHIDNIKRQVLRLSAKDLES